MTLIPIFTGGGGFLATGGTITTSGGYKYHTFTSNGNFTVLRGSKTLEYLVVGGGGSGGVANGYTGNGQYTVTGGGGGGGVGNGTWSSTNLSVTVGVGGTISNGGNGGTSSLLTIPSGIGSPISVANISGGGYGATGTAAATVGSSGGGGSAKYDGSATTIYASAAGTSGQGYAGAAADTGFPSGGGGGGAGGAASGISGGAAITTYSSWGVNAAILGAGGDGGNPYNGSWIYGYGYGSPGVYSANNALQVPASGRPGIVIIRYAI